MFTQEKYVCYSTDLESCILPNNIKGDSPSVMNIIYFKVLQLIYKNRILLEKLSIST